MFNPIFWDNQETNQSVIKICPDHAKVKHDPAAVENWQETFFENCTLLLSNIILLARFVYGQNQLILNAF